MTDAPKPRTDEVWIYTEHDGNQPVKFIRAEAVRELAKDWPHDMHESGNEPSSTRNLYHSDTCKRCAVEKLAGKE